jgi:hypothetical protein
MNFEVLLANKLLSWAESGMDMNLAPSEFGGCSVCLGHAKGASICQLIYVDSVSTKEIKYEERLVERKRPSERPDC